MAEILFLLGHPGSGKSRTARSIREATLRTHDHAVGQSPLQGLSVCHVTDYGFLRQMFLEEQRKKETYRRFHPTSFGGFDVLDPGVLPLALQQVNAYIIRHQHKEQSLLLVEFARRSYSYQEVWRYFHSDVLSRAFFLHLEADIQTCAQRVSKRARSRAFADDQFVSPKIMFDYYGSAAGGPGSLRSDVGSRHVATVENTGAWQETWTRIHQFLSGLSARLARPGSALPPSC
jgi:hypothetical protein